jgi:hypothetical protein
MPVTNPCTCFWRRLGQAALVLLIVLLPLPRHWPLVEQRYPGVNAELTSLNLYLSDFAVLLLLVAAVACLRHRQRSLPEPKALTYPLVLLVLLATMSSLWAFDVVLALQQALRLAILLALVLVLIRLRPNERMVQISLAVIVFVQAAVALLQFSRQDDLGLRWLGEIDLNRYPGGGSILTVADQYWLRGYGLTPHPNILGGLLALALLTLVVAFLQAPRRRRPLWFIVVLVGTAGLFISFSRSAWLGGVMGGAFLAAGVLLQRRWRQRYGRALLALILACGLLFSGLAWQQRDLLLARSNPDSSVREARSIDERSALNAAAVALIRLAPLTGVGAGNSAVATIPLVGDTPGVAPQPAHLAPLLLTAELGVIGGALWLWLMMVPAILALVRHQQGKLTLWALALTAALLAFAVIDLFDYYAWGWQQGRLLRWVYWGLWGLEIGDWRWAQSPISNR